MTKSLFFKSLTSSINDVVDSRFKTDGYNVFTDHHMMRVVYDKGIATLTINPYGNPPIVKKVYTGSSRHQWRSIVRAAINEVNHGGV